MPASKYYANGRMHYTESSTWYETDLYTVNFDGVNVKAKRRGITSDDMTEYYYQIGGDFSIKKIGLTREEVDSEILAMENRILNKLDDSMIPSEENLSIARKIWKRELADCTEEAITTIMTCGRFCPKERRYFAKKLIESNIITVRQLVNYTNELMA
jgi:hypothetical protein